MLDPAADREGCEDDGQVGFDGVAQVVVDGPGPQLGLDMRKLFSIWKIWWQAPITNSAVTGRRPDRPAGC